MRKSYNELGFSFKPLIFTEAGIIFKREGQYWIQYSSTGSCCEVGEWMLPEILELLKEENILADELFEG